METAKSVSFEKNYNFTYCIEIRKQLNPKPSKTLDEERSEFTSALVTARMKVESQENLTDLICTETSSGVVQSLVLVTSASSSLRSECKKLCSFLVKKVFDGATISSSPAEASEESSETQTDQPPGLDTS